MISRYALCTIIALSLGAAVFCAPAWSAEPGQVPAGSGEAVSGPDAPDGSAPEVSGRDLETDGTGTGQQAETQREQTEEAVSGQDEQPAEAGGEAQETSGREPPLTERSAEDLIGELRQRGALTDAQALWLTDRYRGRSVAERGRINDDEFVRELAAELRDQMSREVQTRVREDLRSQILKEARLGNWLTPSLPEWAAKIRLSGDIRTRYQADYYGSGNGELYDLAEPDTPQLVNTTADRQRLRLRVRMNTQIQVADHVDAGITIATGTTADPVSTNVTMGGYNNKKSIVLDRAFIRYRPIPELSIITGRMQNPFFCTDLVWDSDVNFDGAAMVFDTQVGSSFKAFLTAGAFPLYEVEDTSSDKWLYAGQIGMRFKPSEVFRTRIGVAYYHFRNEEGRINDVSYPNLTDWTAPQFYTRGNTLMDIDPTASGITFALAPEFHELAVTASADVSVFDPIHVVLSGEYVKNIGFDYDKVYDRADPSHVASGIPKKTTGYRAMLGVGTAKVSDFGDWRCSVVRKYVGNDCVLDAFTDSDFHTGGTNAKGYVLSAEFGIARNVWTSVNWYSTDEINGPQLSIDTLQVDLNVKF